MTPGTLSCQLSGGLTVCHVPRKEINGMQSLEFLPGIWPCQEMPAPLPSSFPVSLFGFGLGRDVTKCLGQR